jgi:hypothetical protein
VRQISEYGPRTDVMIQKIFSRKKWRKMAFFDSKQSQIMQKFDHIFGFREKRQYSPKNKSKL